MTISFWQKYWRNELIGVEIVLACEQPYLPKSYCETKRKEIINNLIRIQINEYQIDEPRD